MVEPLTVAQVTPYAWEDAHEVNLVVRGLSGELARRGHRVLVLAPTRSPQHARDGRGTVRAAAGDTDRLLDGESLRVLPIGELLEVPGRRGGARSLPLDVARSVEEVLTAGRFDVVHVHEPWAPSAASAALRHSRALNVGSFHTPTERLLSAQLGRRVVELVFGRLDARTASFAATRDMLKRLFPADYRVITPAVGPPGLLEPPPPGTVPHIAARSGEPVRVNTHDFPSYAMGKAIPYGIYDLARNEGWVSVGVSRDTAQFAVASIAAWWHQLGQPSYPNASSLTITADSGGSNSARGRLWKVEPQKLSDQIGLEIVVCPFPRGTSKWNKIEHRLFSFISHNWRGKPLIDYATIINLITSTTTSTGLKVYARLDETDYPKGIEVTNAELAKVNLRRHDFHGDWNYTVSPSSATATVIQS